MLFIPPPSHPPKQHTRKDSVRRGQRSRNRRLRVAPSLGKKMKSTLSTSEGMSTLKIVLMYSVLGMVLNWVLPIILLNLSPEMLKEDSQYFGTLGAILITVLFLTFSLIKGLIQRSRSQKEGSESHPSNTHLFDPKKSNK